MTRSRIYAVYIMTTRRRRVLYVGVTGDLRRRVAEHKCGRGGGFSHRYALDSLVWYEIYQDVRAAITREKQLKSGSRLRKIRLIEGLNPEWRDLSTDL